MLRRSLVPRRTTRPLVAVAALIAVAALVPGSAHAAKSCRSERFRVADKLQQCRHKALLYNLFSDRQDRLAKCLVKYVAAWPKLPCTGSQFTDNGDGTVTDNLTGLQWERKTDDGSIHDRDDVYTWSTSGSAADGTVFTSFLATLNLSGVCFAGHCDWRLPTPAELQAIQRAPYPSCDGACLDPAVFGPLAPAPTWSALTAATATAAWNTTAVGAEIADPKTSPYAVRAVRSAF